MKKWNVNILSYTSKPEVDFLYTFVWSKTICISRGMYSLPPLVTPKKYFSTLKWNFLRKFCRFEVPTPKYRCLENVKNISNISLLSTYYLKEITLSFPTKKYVFILKIEVVMRNWNLTCFLDFCPDFRKKC